MDRTTLPKEDKVDTSSAEVPMAQTLVARLESKVSDDTPIDDYPELLNFSATESEIVCQKTSGCRAASLTKGNRTVRFGIPDGLIFAPPDTGPAFFVLRHKDVKGGLWVALRLAPLILLPLAILRTLWLNHPRWPLFPYDDLPPFGLLGLGSPNQDLLSLELNHVHIHQEHVLVELHLGTFCKFQSSFIYG
jgi:hypothetical protein